MRSLVRSLLPVLFFAFALAAFGQQPAATEERHSDHEELRAMLRTATDALNRYDINALAPMFAQRCYITTVDGQSFHDLAGFKSYLDGLYASRISKIEFHPVADNLTTFLDADTGVCAGSSRETYTFKDGDSRTMNSRWTATVHKEGGRWKLAALHMSANILDNPVVDATKKKAYAGGAGALVLGLIIGYVIRMVARRT